ncbi:MAG: C25 family cysteine peptidase, partial [bacterium]|nr:C25 family cysteine peptidase [bacterium]
KQVKNWRDATADYYKIPIRQDGLYRLNAEWFSQSQIALGPGDLERVKIYLDGREVPLLVEDGGDGQLDEGDGVYFWGTYHRAPNRDHVNEFGATRIYWLTADGAPGIRYAQVDAAPISGFPEATSFVSSVHAEIDSTFEALGLARDANRDHWFWKRTASPSSPTDIATPVVMPVALPGVLRQGEARIQVAMHSLTTSDAVNPDHYAVVRLENGPVVGEGRWEGQEVYVISGAVPGASLSDTIGVVLSSPGDPSFPFEPLPYVDHAFFDWVSVAYPSRFEARDGSLLFAVDALRQVVIKGFTAEKVRILNLDAVQKLNGPVTASGGHFDVRLETRAEGRFVAVAENRTRVPDFAIRDEASHLREPQQGAAYVIVAPAEFRDAAQQLADHRQSLGLSAMVVDVGDIYDEFSFGQVHSESIRAFVQYAYAQWTQRPVYVLLFGRFSFDYRDLFGLAGTGRQNFIPSIPFQSVRRGLAFSDEYFGRVDDDLFMDVFIGRFSINYPSQANLAVQRVTAYDRAEPARWRDRMLLMANWDDLVSDLFTGPSDSLAALAEEIGLEPLKVYHTSETPPEPNASSQEVIRQINEGRLIVNFMGHGSAASMSRYIAGTFQQGGFDYMSQIKNAERLPLFIGMSCLNGLYWDPRIICFAEEMTNKPDGGAIGYVSASSLAFIGINNEINTAMLKRVFRDRVLEMGQMLALAKMDVLAQFPGFESGITMMNLMGDPAQALALPDGPDFVINPNGLRLDRLGDLTTGDSVRVVVTVENWGLRHLGDLEVAVVDQNLDTGQTDTLFLAGLPSVVQTDSIAVVWHLANRAGRHLLQAILDPRDKVVESDEGNNRVSRDVDVLGALTTLPTLPHNSQMVAAGSARFGVRSGTGEGDLLGEFELGATVGFDGEEVQRSGLLPGTRGMLFWQPMGLTTGTYFWRARLTDGETAGPWTPPQNVAVAGQAPERTVAWLQQGPTAFAQGEKQDVALFDGGVVQRVKEPPPIRFNAAEKSFAAEGLRGSATLCTDGTYLYVNRFYSSQNLYPGTDVLMRIGTGFNGTVAGQNYGPLTDLPISGISATYHSDGYIYAEHRKSHSVVRISAATGRVDTVTVADGLLDLARGLTFDDHALITSDGTYIYNVSTGVNGIRRAGWSVRVFDPADSWRVVRNYTVGPTETGFGFLFTDGIIADGRFLYLIEFGTGMTHRVRVVDAQTGAFVEEFESDQASTDILSGQYDWLNNRVWLGQLNGARIHQYPGRGLPTFGTLTSVEIGPSSGWQSLTLSLVGTGRVDVDILGETEGGGFVGMPAFQGLNGFQPVDLSGLGSRAPRIQIRARFFGEGLNPSAGLKAWQVGYQPLSDVGLANLQADPQAVQELQTVRLTVDVQNRGPLDLTLGTSVAFYAGNPQQGKLIGRAAIPERTPVGDIATVTWVWQTAQFAGQHLVTARLEDFQNRPAFVGREAKLLNPVIVSPSEDTELPTVDISALDALGAVRADDYLPSEPTFRITVLDSAGINLGSIRFNLAGSVESNEGDYESGRIQDRLVTPYSLAFTYR